MLLPYVSPMTPDDLDELMLLERRCFKDPWSRRILARGSLKLTFVLGVALSLPGALYLVALKDIAEANPGTAVSVALVIAYNLIMFSLAEIPLLGYAVAPERTQAIVNEANAWLGDHARQVAMWRAAHEGGVVLMGGATPSLEAWHHMREGTIAPLMMGERISGGRMPTVEVVDMRRSTGPLSGRLLEEIARTREMGRQTILSSTAAGSPISSIAAAAGTLPPAGIVR